MASPDVVIIGAGLAGLSAAHRLRDFDVLVLERERRAGGRVLTAANPISPIDLGACFAVGPDVFPGVPPPEEKLLERGPIGILRDGTLYLGDSSWECIEKMPWDAASRAALEDVRDGRAPFDALPRAALDVVNAFFKQIHAGHVCDYLPARQMDAFNPIYPNHYPSGNGPAVEAHLSALGERVRVALGHVAIALHETADGVTVTYEAADLSERKLVACEAVIVATTADVARALVRPADPRYAALLESVRYGTYTVVGLVVDAPDLPRFRYLVTPDQPLNVVIQQAAADGRHRKLICYYSDPLAHAAASLSDDDLVATTLRQLDQFGLAKFDRSRVVFSAIRRWDVVGPVLSPAYAAAKAAIGAQPTGRIFLAGDYMSADTSWGYGTVDAVNSGRATAELVRAMLASRLKTQEPIHDRR